LNCRSNNEPDSFLININVIAGNVYINGGVFKEIKKIQKVLIYLKIKNHGKKVL
jgi:hypothetical protein